ncbi:MAG: cyclophilin-like fold protein [bacterium]|nr:cyclophilin-like fold protein [bacterium]
MAKLWPRLQKAAVICLIAVSAAGVLCGMRRDTLAQASPVKNQRDYEMSTTLKLQIGGQAVTVSWENNETVAALRKLAAQAPLTIKMSRYGGFEQVGSLGTSLPRSDKQLTTEAGDIVLYSGNQLVVFYGSNSWAYTRLGRITGKNAAELAQLLDHNNVTILISSE